MRATRTLAVFLTVLLAAPLVSVELSSAAPLIISHQGRLTDNSGAPLTGSFDMTFSLYSTPTGGVALWTEDQTIIATDGLFNATLGKTVPLSAALFATGSNSMWLGVAAGDDLELTPRTELTSAPYALSAASVDGFSSGPGNTNIGQFSIVGGDNNTNLSDLSTILGGEDNTVDVTVFADTIFDTSGLVPQGGAFARASLRDGISMGTILGGHFNYVNGNHSVITQGWEDSVYAAQGFIGTGWRNVINNNGHYSVITGGAFNRSSVWTSVISGGVFNRNNSAAGVFNTGQSIGGGWQNSTESNFSTIGGGSRNNALGANSTIGGGQLDSAMGSNSTVSGGTGNTAVSSQTTVGGGARNRADGPSSTIAGGEGNLTVQHNHQSIGGGQDNRTAGPYSTIAGGQSNGTTAGWATIGGGMFNHANADNSFIGGGIDNLATAISATVGGGVGNVASGPNSFVGGGDGNIAGPGDFATVAGGFRNIASGAHSFAAGTNAHAPDSCTFIWADCCPIGGTPFSLPFTTSAPNTFNARATNGFYFMTTCDSIFDPAAGVGAGVYVPAGGSMWMTGSSRTLKKNITPVDESDILAKVEQMPVYRWSYKTQDDDVEHIGPMAEDFYATFNLGENDRTIGSLDPAGVSLAATKALIKENNELKARLERLEKIVNNLIEQN